MDYKITIWHHLKDEASANSMCEELLTSNIPNIKVVWACSRFYVSKSLDYRRLCVDIQTLSEISPEEICQCFLEKWSDAISYIMFESDRSSWQKFFEWQEEIKKRGKYVEVPNDARSVSRALPFSENIIMVANSICPFDGGVLIKEHFNEEIYSTIEENLKELGFYHISAHNLQKKCYKIDFSTNIIKGAALINNGWYRDEFGIWRHSKINAELVYPNPNRNKMQRESKWYKNEPEYIITPVKQDTFFDYSDDDSSLNPAFW